jgi:ABC-2 type transport system ATP-binding protein
MPEKQNAIDVRGLTKRFPGVLAVDHIDFQVRSGEIFGLVGPDGAGKTTTLRMLAGLMAPDEGGATVAGADVVRRPQDAQNQLSYMPQRFGLYEDLSTDENIRFYADLFGVRRGDREARAQRLLAAAGMSPFRDRLAGKLSGGMKQKLALMCTLLHHPQVLFLDEPTNGVDPVSRRDFWAILYDLVKDGMTVLVTTAYLDEAERCNRVGLMTHGRLIRCDAPDALRTSLPEECYEVRSPDRHSARELLLAAEGVTGVEPAGDALHLFLDPARTSPRQLEQLGPFTFQPIEPSLEDVFIALIRREVTS